MELSADLKGAPDHKVKNPGVYQVASWWQSWIELPQSLGHQSSTHSDNSSSIRERHLVRRLIRFLGSVPSDS